MAGKSQYPNEKNTPFYKKGVNYDKVEKSPFYRKFSKEKSYVLGIFSQL